MLKILKDFCTCPCCVDKKSDDYTFTPDVIVDEKKKMLLEKRTLQRRNAFQTIDTLDAVDTFDDYDFQTF